MRPPPRPALAFAVLLLGSIAALPSPGRAQDPFSAEAGFEHPDVVDVGLLLRQLPGVKRVLMIGAHPDDEDTSLLAALARGQGAETAYLSLTRGEGGQNLIGPELGVGLGIIRTGELLAARRLDGGAQFFTRAYDFGFSKSAEETFEHWPREEILRDVVRIVRAFRPQIVISVFSGTPRDGHGHHQVAGILAREAFTAAADPARFPEQLAEGLTPWAPAKLFQRQRGQGGLGVVEVETGVFDPLLGRSHYQVAMASRSQHRSQDMGVPQPSGSRTSTLILAESRVGEGAEATASLFSGIDTTLVGIARRAGAANPQVEAELDRYLGAVGEAATSLTVLEPGRAVPPLARAVRSLREVLYATESRTGAGELRDIIDRKLILAQRALLAAASVAVEARLGDGLLVPGETVELSIEVWNGGRFAITETEPTVVFPEGWSADPSQGRSPATGRGARGDAGGGGPPGARGRAGAGDAAQVASEGIGPPEGGGIAPGEVRRWTMTVHIPADATLSQLYYLERPREGDLYEWPRGSTLRGLPRDPALLSSEVAVELDIPGLDEGIVARAAVPARYVAVDEALGEYEERPLVVPALGVSIEPGILVWPSARSEEREVTVRVRSQSEAAMEAVVRLRGPAGWSIEPSGRSVQFTGPAEERSLIFRLRPGASVQPGRHTLRAEAETADGRTFTAGYRIVDYPHIERAALFAPAGLEVSLFPLAIRPGIRIGYIMGSGDDGAEALGQIGADIEVLDEARVRAGDFSSFDAIVLGVRAYEVRPDLAAANAALLDWVRAGGTLVVQYNQYEYASGGYAPYPVSISRPHDRVTDEHAPVRILRPDAPVFTTPNRIGADDFEGWVQDRGLYFLGEWDERYTPLLEMADPGEDPERGSLVVASVGQGVYVYTGLAFFRQFGSGVPGAYRLLANLVSLTGEDWRAYINSGGWQ